MLRRIYIPVIILLWLSSSYVSAQQVLYSSYIDNRSSLQFMIAGKAGDYYWLQNERRKKSGEQNFEIYDARLNLVKIMPAFALGDQVSKEYFIPGAKYFDQLLLLVENKKTNLILQRFSPEGEVVAADKMIASLHFAEPGTSYLLIRSEDKNKILLLCFESVPSSPPRLHAVLFNEDWKQISYQVYEHPFITQPFIQDDFICHPAEHFNNDPVQLANNGQWLMAAPSRTNLNYLLFHFYGTDTGLSYKEIRLPAAYTMQDVSLSIDNEKGEAFAGILSGFKFTTHKQVQVTHYSMIKQAFDFDSSYHLNTLAGGKEKNQNITKEKFIALPGAGFMLLKEYGRVFNDWYNADTYHNQWDPELLFTGGYLNDSSAVLPISPDGYTRYSRLSGPRNNYDRGDLSLFYFPAHTRDSCWSGIINKAQITELNAPYLSYLTIPVKNKLFILYNNFLHNDDHYSNATILDRNGNQHTEESMIFWKFNNILSFQQSTQIAENEIAIPYTKNQRKGFAVLKF